MTQTNTINRRNALTTLGMAGAVALVTPAAALPKLTATEDQHLLDLWQRFVAAEVQYADAVSNSDHADWKARQELIALPCPWTPLEIGHELRPYISQERGSTRLIGSGYMGDDPQEAVTRTEFLERARRFGTDKARELGWIE